MKKFYLHLEELTISSEELAKVMDIEHSYLIFKMPVIEKAFIETLADMPFFKVYYEDKGEDNNETTYPTDDRYPGLKPMYYLTKWQSEKAVNVLLNRKEEIEKANKNLEEYWKNKTERNFEVNSLEEAKHIINTLSHQGIWYENCIERLWDEVTSLNDCLAMTLAEKQ